MSDGLNATSTSLIRRAVGREDEAWCQLVDTYSLMIYRWCRRGGLSPDDARDACQDVFAAISHGIGHFRRDRPGDAFRKWIRAITTNKLRDYWRSRRAALLAVGGSTWLGRVSAVADRGDADNPTTLIGLCLDENLRDEAILQVRAEVSARDWSIFERLVFDDGYPRDVAEEFGVSLNVVYLVKSRILKYLRIQLESRASARDA